MGPNRTLTTTPPATGERTPTPAHSTIPDLRCRPCLPQVRDLRQMDRISFLQRALLASRPPQIVTTLIRSICNHRKNNKSHGRHSRGGCHQITPQLPRMMCYASSNRYLKTALPSVCGENAFTPLLFTPYFIQFIHSAILHTQVTHTFYLVF